MDAQRLEYLIDTYGIPTTQQEIIDAVRNHHHVDVSHIVQPPTQNTEPGQLGNGYRGVEPPLELFRHYELRRDALNHSRAIQQARTTWSMSIGRGSSPRGYLDNNWSMNNPAIQAMYDFRNNPVEIPVPVVFDQNTRLDLSTNPMPDAPDHIRCQVLLPTGTTTSRGYNSPTVPSLIRPTFGLQYPELFDASNTALIAEGWIPIERGGIALGWKLPEEIDPNGRHVIAHRLFKSHYEGNRNMAIVMECLMDIRDRWTNATPEETDNTNASNTEHIGDTRDLIILQNIAQQSNSRIQTLTTSISRHRDSARSLEAQIATALRSINDETAELEALNSSGRERILTQARAMFGVADQIREMRPISEASVDVNNGKAVLKFVTKRFGMRYGNRCIMIPRIEFEIDMMSNNYYDGIVIRRHESNTSHYSHPHLSPVRGEETHNPCWGNAGRRPIPEAWANREWTNLVRIIVSWVTQHTSGDHMTPMSIISQEFHVAPHAGWIEEDEESVVNNDETVDLGEPVPLG